MTISMNFIPVF
jgi:hypothetical protein